MNNDKTEVLTIERMMNGRVAKSWACYLTQEKNGRREKPFRLQ